MFDELGKIRFARFRFQLRAETLLRLPPYKGSTLRGGFGMAFKDAVCVVAHRDCERCILKSKCAYPYIFETPVPNGSRRMASLEHAPHPFVIEPPLGDDTRYAEGDVLAFVLVLVGRAIDYLPYFIFAFEELGSRRGIGKEAERQAESDKLKAAFQPKGEGGKVKARRERGRFTVERVTAFNGGNGEGTPVYDGKSKALSGTIGPQTIRDVFSSPRLAFDFPLSTFDRPGSLACDFELSTLGSPACHLPLSYLELSFLTPTRLIFDRTLATVPEFHILIRNLLRRLSNLAYFHCDGELDLDFRGLVDAAQEVKLVENRTRWHDWERYSARQDAKLKMGGVVGDAVYEGDLEPFAPLLALGEVLHVGKGTGFGLGRYRIDLRQR